MARAVALGLLLASAKVGESFLLSGSRVTLATSRRRQHEHVASNDMILGTSSRPPIGPLTVTRMTAHDASTQQQQQQVLPLAAELLNDEGGSSESLNDATKPAAAPENHSRTGVALDGTPLEFKRPSTQDLHKLGMGEWVARKSVSLALVALDGNAATDEGDAVGNAPLAGSVVEAVGGSSVATRACLLRHRRAVGVSEAVEHVLLDETIAQFLNEGAKLSQVGSSQ